MAPEGYWNRMKETTDTATILYTTLTSAKNCLSSTKKGLTSARNGGGVLGLTNYSAKMPPFFELLEVVIKKNEKLVQKLFMHVDKNNV